MWTFDDTLAYLSGKGKGHRSHASGKGFGRRKNPRGRDGSLTKCHNCGADDHLVARCPKGSGKGGRPGKPSGSASFAAFAAPDFNVGESGSAETHEGRVFADAAPAPWEEYGQYYSSAFMINGVDLWGNPQCDPWLSNGGPAYGPRPYVPPPATPATGMRAWAN